jgi:hypothetical protein
VVEPAKVLKPREIPWTAGKGSSDMAKIPEYDETEDDNGDPVAGEQGRD